jgi:hypothetical protein
MSGAAQHNTRIESAWFGTGAVLKNRPPVPDAQRLKRGARCVERAPGPVGTGPGPRVCPDVARFVFAVL